MKTIQNTMYVCFDMYNECFAKTCLFHSAKDAVNGSSSKQKWLPTSLFRYELFRPIKNMCI